MTRTARHIMAALLVAPLAAPAQHASAQQAGAPHAAHAASPANAASAANAVVVKELMTKAMADIPGKEVLMITVDYAPGAGDPVHRHDAHAFVYVLEGSIVMGVQGGKEVTLKPGDTFYEAPGDVHTVGRNASTTRPAKFVVLLVKSKGADFFIPVK